MGHCQMCIKTGDMITTPAMFMTGTGDFEVLPAQVKSSYKNDSATPKSYRNDKGRGHTEMLNLLVQYNPAVASQRHSSKCISTATRNASTTRCTGMGRIPSATMKPCMSACITSETQLLCNLRSSS